MSEVPLQDDPPIDEVEVEVDHGVPVTVTPQGQRVLHPSRGELLAVAAALRDQGYWMCVDVCAADYLTHPGRSGLPPTVAAERFEVVVSLLNHTTNERVRLRVQVPADDLTCPSLFALFPGSETPEREAYDMFGVVFEGHPDLTRILMPDDWDGHPLRKDASVGRIPVQFKSATNAR